MQNELELPIDVWPHIAAYVPIPQLVSLLSVSHALQSAIVQEFANANNFKFILNQVFKTTEDGMVKKSGKGLVDSFTHLLKLFLKYEYTYPFDNITQILECVTDDSLFKLSGESMECVKLLLDDSRADPTVHNNIILRVGSIMGDVELVDLLLKNENVNPSVQENFPLILVAGFNHMEVAKLLVKHPRFNTQSLYHALTMAVTSGSLEMLQLLIDLPNQDHIDYFDLLSTAIMTKNAEKIKMIIKRKGTSSQDKNRFFQKMLNERLFDMVTLMLDDIEEPFLESMLITMVERGDIEAVKVLIDAGVSASGNENSAILFAAQYGFTQITKLLLKDKRVDLAFDRYRPLAVAVEIYNTEIAEMMLADARVDKNDEEVQKLMKKLRE
jgi:hypothetical protein